MGKSKHAKQKMAWCHFVLHKSHTDWPKLERRPLRLANNRRPLTHEYKWAKFLDIRKHIALFEPSQAAPACLSQKSVLRLNMEQRWNDTDKGKPKYSKNN